MCFWYGTDRAFVFQPESISEDQSTANDPDTLALFVVRCVLTVLHHGVCSATYQLDTAHQIFVMRCLDYQRWIAVSEHGSTLA